MNASFTIAYFVLMFTIIVVTHKLEDAKQQDVRPELPDLPTDPPQHPHQFADDQRLRRRRAYDLGTTQNVSPEEFVELERQGYFLGLTRFTNERGEEHAIVVVAVSEADYRRHEADR